MSVMLQSGTARYRKLGSLPSGPCTSAIWRCAKDSDGKRAGPDEGDGERPQYAIKLQRQNPPHEPSRPHLQTETRLLQRLQGSTNHVCELLDAFHDWVPHGGGCAYMHCLVMPCYSGTLRDAMRQDGFDARDATQQLLAAVLAIHEQGIYHRDLKPENIALDRERGTLVLIDFGLGTDRRAGAECVVSQWYRPPEVLFGARTCHVEWKGVDYWALGGIVWECFRGAPLFGAGANDSLFDTWNHIWREVLRPEVHNFIDDGQCTLLHRLPELDVASKVAPDVRDPPMAQHLGHLLQPNPTRRTALTNLRRFYGACVDGLQPNPPRKSAH